MLPEFLDQGKAGSWGRLSKNCLSTRRVCSAVIAGCYERGIPVRPAGKIARAAPAKKQRTSTSLLLTDDLWDGEPSEVTALAAQQVPLLIPPPARQTAAHLLNPPKLQFKQTPSTSAIPMLT